MNMRHFAYRVLQPRYIVELIRDIKLKIAEYYTWAFEAQNRTAEHKIKYPAVLFILFLVDIKACMLSPFFIT